MPERLRTIPITCGADGQEHQVSDENMAAGRHAGLYQALCGYRVVAAAMVAPPGRPCFLCTEVLAAAQRPTCPARRGRHRWHGWLWRMLHPSRQVRGSDHEAGPQVGGNLGVQQGQIRKEGSAP